MSMPSDKTVRIPGRLWPQIESLAREQLRTPPEMVRTIIEKTLIARQLKRQTPQDLQNRAIIGGANGSNS